MVSLVAACGEKPKLSNFTQNKLPDLTIGAHRFYLNTFPTRPLSVCTDKQSQLNFDGTYLTVKICRTAFGAGGCGVEKYRTKDFENWQEYIGITWHENEQYEAWRQLGSNSSKADDITKVVPAL